jgi:hypothetical protein
MFAMLHDEGLSDWGLEGRQAHAAAAAAASGEEACEAMGCGCYCLSLVVG